VRGEDLTVSEFKNSVLLKTDNANTAKPLYKLLTLRKIIGYTIFYVLNFVS